MLRARGFNGSLEAYCLENNIGFFNVWDHFMVEVRYMLGMESWDASFSSRDFGAGGVNI